MEYKATSDWKRAVVSGAYDGIQTALLPETYNVYVEEKTVQNALKVFSEFFQAPILGYGKEGTLKGIFGGAEKQKSSNASASKRKFNQNMKNGGKKGKKNWQNNKSAISNKMQKIGLPALR